MELYWIRYFKTLARLENMTQAAAELHITQPTLSQTISKLEKELGVKLFNRSHNRITLNDRGEIFLRDVEQILVSLDRTIFKFQQMNEEEHGYISVGVSTPRIMRTSLTRFMLAHPNIRVQTLIYTANQMLEALMNHQIDFALSFTSIDPAHLYYTPLYKENYVLVCSKDHPLLDGTPKSLSQFKKERFYLNSINPDLNRGFIECCQRAGFSPDVYFSGHETNTICELVSLGYGVAILSHFQDKGIAQSERDQLLSRIGNYDVGVIDLSDPFCSRESRLYTLRNTALSPSARLLYNHLLQELSSDPQALPTT